MVRITQSILSGQTLFNLQTNINRVANLQNQLSTGRRINSPSDDPIDFTNSLSQRTTIQMGRSYQRNINNARTNLELSETSMGSLTDVLQSIRTLAVQGASEDNDTNARLAIAEQIKELYGQVLDLANSNYNGQYIFGGSETKETPFVAKDGTVLYNGDDFERDALIGKGTKVASNVTGFDAFLHTPNQITSSVKLDDATAPLAEQLRQVYPDFPNLPPLPGPVPAGTTEASPNPDNSPSALPNNYAAFSIYGTKIEADLSVDSLEDLKNRINIQVPDVVASITGDNRLVITSRRADALDLQDGSREIGFEADPPFGTNILTALGLHQRIENQRSLAIGYPATDPLTDGTVTPAPTRSTVRVQDDSFLFVSTNTGPDTDKAVPFGDNLALTNVDKDGNEIFDTNDNPEFISELQAIRVTIDEEVIDIDLRGLTQGVDFDATAGNADDVPGSTLGDLVDILNNHPELKGKATAFINADGTGIGISATKSTDVFQVENVRKLFGRDITTRVVTDALTGAQTVTRIDPITRDTKLEDIPGALVGGTPPVSQGIRLGQPIPGIDLPDTNMGLVTIDNNGQTDTIDLREAETVADVLRAFNESKAGVVADINAFGTGITVESKIGTSENLSVRDMFDGTAARDLGLFTPPKPMRIQSNNVAAFTNAQLLDDAAVAPNMVDGQFTIEVRDNNGATLDTYTIDASATDTIADLVKRIDTIDGEEGPGGGLISANLAGGTINIVSNYDGHQIFIDPANDTTGTDATTRFTSQIGIDRITVTDETNIPQAFYSSSQRTADILGLDGNGTSDEIKEQNVFRSIQGLEESLRNDNTEGVQQALEDLDVDLDKALTTRTSLGSRLNRMDAADFRLQQAEDQIRQQLSYVEDVDLAGVINDLTLAENAFNAALSASGRIIQQSLINFL